jgi:hypothetical protein
VRRAVPPVMCHIGDVCQALEPFFTTKEIGKGTGQRLASARATIVQKHKGPSAYKKPSTGSSLSVPTS